MSPPNQAENHRLTAFGAPIAYGPGEIFSPPTVMSASMNATLYFELVDAVAKVGGPADLEVVAQRISATPMHPLERRVLDRAVRARTEAFALQHQVLLASEQFAGSLTELSAATRRG